MENKLIPQLKNNYFLVRHGQNTYQAEHPDVGYFWPDGNPPYQLTELGREEALRAGEAIIDKIDVVFSSDILRCRDTAKIICEAIGYDKEKIIYDLRLRDWNWGDLAGSPKEKFWGFYDHDHFKAFEIPVPGGESWSQCQARIVGLFNEIEEEFENKNILIVSHGDPLWLLEGYIKEIDNKTLLEKRKEIYPKTGEVKSFPK